MASETIQFLAEDLRSQYKTQPLPPPEESEGSVSSLNILSIVDRRQLLGSSTDMASQSSRLSREDNHAQCLSHLIGEVPQGLTLDIKLGHVGFRAAQNIYNPPVGAHSNFNEAARIVSKPLKLVHQQEAKLNGSIEGQLFLAESDKQNPVLY